MSLQASISILSDQTERSNRRRTFSNNLNIDRWGVEWSWARYKEYGLWRAWRAFDSKIIWSYIQDKLAWMYIMEFEEVNSRYLYCCLGAKNLSFSCSANVSANLSFSCSGPTPCSANENSWTGRKLNISWVDSINSQTIMLVCPVNDKCQ